MKKIVIGNWKMSLTLRESIALAKGVVQGQKKNSTVDVVLCPSFTALASAGPLLSGGIALGAQDVFWEEKGAFTGEIAPRLLHEMGCSFVIVGHSERRQHLLETDAMVNKKVHAALRGGLTPIICVGETNDERRSGQKDYVVMQQVAKAVQGITLAGAQQLIVAYEPVWVIGTGQAVAPDDAVHMTQVIRHTLADTIPQETIARSCRVVYGGSVDASNVASFTKSTLIDGVLVGGASTTPASFCAIIEGVAAHT